MARDPWDRMGDIDRIAERFIPTRGRAWSRVLEFAELFKGGVLADLGCGNGRHAIPIAKGGREVIALDISQKLVAHVSRRGRREGLGTLHPVVGSVTHIPIRTGYLEGALLVAVLHHIPTFRLRVETLRELWRVLRPGGRTLITVWSALQPRQILPLAMGLLKALIRRLWEPMDAEVPWRIRGQRIVYRFYHLYTPWELSLTLRISAPWLYRVVRFDVKKSAFPQNYMAIARKK